ncbi:MAG: sn-glycerol-1-phosphate dehydrogenase [Lachnospiraceae bacterium]|nr:sn-glycerol-1-phosphate dehydrogenase [Lachnospiraceae bacterium]
MIREILVYEEPLKQALLTLEAPVDAQELGISQEDLIQSFLWAKEIRSKYVVLDLADDLGILNKIAEKISLL